MSRPFNGLRSTWLASIISLGAFTVVPATVAFAEEEAALDPTLAPGGEADPAAAAEAMGEGEALSEEEQEKLAKAAFMSSLNPRSGAITVGDNLAEFRVPESYGFLGPEEAERVLQAWGNPPGSEALGLLYPRELGLLEDASWAVIVTYTEDGHVEDDDAEDIDYDELLSEMKSDTEEANAARTEGGFGAVHLIGWAEPPRYDKDAKKLYWAKELDFAGGEEHTLNYAIRLLGRKGVLELNAVAAVSQLGLIKKEMAEVISFGEFKEGSRYADFDPDMDSVAAYGIGALVAGKLAAKAGLFKGLIALLIASKKFLIIGVVALAAGVTALFFGSKAQPSDTANS
jgi:uncharacterized membrane-anchored protein